MIFLDFDGVLSDSVKEAYILARYAYLNISPFEPIDENEFANFRAFRPQITNSWQYCFFFNSDEKNTEKFNQKFLSMRKELMTKHHDFWQTLETPTPFLFKINEFIKQKPEHFKILSTKNRDAIVEKLKYCNIDFNPEFIYDKKDLLNTTKGEFIHSLNLKNSILIDDSEENLETCKKYPQIKTYLTTWGYAKNPQNGLNEDEILEIIKEKLCL